jgi:hypothetical protein
VADVSERVWQWREWVGEAFFVRGEIESGSMRGKGRSTRAVRVVIIFRGGVRVISNSTTKFVPVGSFGLT